MAKKKTVAPKTAEKPAGEKVEKKKRRPKQGTLPTMEDERDEALSVTLDEYVEARDQRQAAGRVEKAKKDVIMARLREKGVRAYHDPESGLTAEITVAKENLKVKLAGDEVKDDDEADGEDGGESDGGDSPF